MPKLNIRPAFIASILAALILSACAQPQPTTTPEPPAPTVTPAIIGAPEPLSPEDGSYFVDSAQTLTWAWPPGLREGQSYAVRIWVGDMQPQEIWTTADSLDVREAIDGFARQTGDYHWQVVVINASPDKGFEGTASEWSPVQTIHRVRHISPTPRPDAEMSNTAKYFKSQNFGTTDALVDAVREFVYTYSDYQPRSEPGKPDRSDTLEKMYQFYQENGPAPEVECSARATAMLTVLAELGIDSHLIFLYADGEDAVGEHTVLEVFNPDTGRWEVTDPTYNVYYVDAVTGDRASIAALVFAPDGSMIPCEGCAAEDAARSSSHFEAYRIGYTDIFYVNLDRFDIARRFPGEHDRNLAEYLTGDPADFTFKFAPPPDS